MQVRGTQFIVQDRPVFFTGTNNYYQMLHRRTGRSAEADEILDKMHRVGYDGLTREEKNLLQRASQMLSREDE